MFERAPASPIVTRYANKNYNKKRTDTFPSCLRIIYHIKSVKNMFIYMSTCHLLSCRVQVIYVLIQLRLFTPTDFFHILLRAIITSVRLSVSPLNLVY